MAGNVNIPKAIGSFSAARRSRGAVVADATKNDGLSVIKGWKLSVLSKAGKERLESGNFLGRIAKGICGQRSVDKFFMLSEHPEGALEKLYSMFEESSRSSMGTEWAKEVRETAQRAFRTPEQVTPAKVESFFKMLDRSVNHIVDEQYGVVNKMMRGTYRDMFKALDADSAATLLKYIEAAYNSEVAGIELTEQERPLVELYEKGALYFKNFISAHEYQLASVDETAPDAAEKKHELEDSLDKKRNEYSEFQERFASRLKVRIESGVAPEVNESGERQRFTTETEQTVEKPSVVAWEKTSGFRAFDPDAKAGKSQLRTPDSPKGKRARRSSIVSLERAADVERSRFKKHKEALPLEEAVLEMAELLKLSYDKGEYDWSGGQVKFFSNTAERLADIGTSTLSAKGKAAVQSMLHAEALTKAQSVIDHNRAVREQYFTARKAFEPHFREACDAYDDALEMRETRLIHAAESLSKARKDKRKRAAVNLDAERVELTSDRLAEAIRNLDIAKRDAPEAQVILREAYEQSTDKINLAGEYLEIKDLLESALDE